MLQTSGNFGFTLNRNCVHRRQSWQGRCRSVRTAVAEDAARHYQLPAHRLGRCRVFVPPCVKLRSETFEPREESLRNSPRCTSMKFQLEGKIPLNSQGHV